MILDSNLISINRQYLSTTSTVTGIPVPLTGFKNPGRQGPIQVCIFISESVSWDIRFNIYQSNSPDGPWKRCATQTVHAPKRGRFLAWRFLPRSVKKQWIYFEAVTEEWGLQTVQVFAAITIEDLRWYEDGLFIDWRGGTSGIIRPSEGETPPEDLPEIEESEEAEEGELEEDDTEETSYRTLVITCAASGTEDSGEIEDFEVEETGYPDEDIEQNELEEEDTEETSYRTLVITCAAGGTEDSGDIEDFEVEETGYPDEDIEQNELEEGDECTESSGVYRGLVIGKSEAEGGDDSSESVEELESDETPEFPKEYGEEWYILCCGYICGDTIDTCGDGYIQMGSCPWLCLDNSYVCNSGSCGSCGTCGGAFAIICGYFDSNCSCLISNCACYGGGMLLDYSCATICDSCFNCNCASYGGGMYLSCSSYATICDSCFDCNCACYGGGMFLTFSCATICDSCFCSNCAVRCGGGMDLVCSCATICDSYFCSNCAVCYGGGMYLTFSCATICDSCFCSNCAVRYGGGMSLYYSCATFAGCNIFCGNHASCCGNSLYVSGTGSCICICIGGCVLDYDGACSNCCMSCCTACCLPNWCNCTARSVLDISVAGVYAPYSDNSGLNARIVICEGGALLVNNDTIFPDDPVGEAPIMTEVEDEEGNITECYELVCTGMNITVNSGGIFDMTARTSKAALGISKITFCPGAIFCSAEGVARSTQPLITSPCITLPHDIIYHGPDTILAQQDNQTWSYCNNLIIASTINDEGIAVADLSDIEFMDSDVEEAKTPVIFIDVNPNPATVCQEVAITVTATGDKVKCLATCIGNSKLTGVCHSSSGMVTETYTYRPRSAKEYIIKATACNSNGKGSACTILEVK